MRSSQTSTYCACAGGRGAEADLRHVSVSEHPTTDIRETCTYTGNFDCHHLTNTLERNGVAVRKGGGEDTCIINGATFIGMSVCLSNAV